MKNHMATKICSSLINLVTFQRENLKKRLGYQVPAYFLGLGGGGGGFGLAFTGGGGFLNFCGPAAANADGGSGSDLVAACGGGGEREG